MKIEWILEYFIFGSLREKLFQGVISRKVRQLFPQLFWSNISPAPVIDDIILRLFLALDSFLIS